MKDLTGKRALITGGSAGLVSLFKCPAIPPKIVKQGFAVAAELASRGCKCALNYANDEERANKALASLPGKGHLLVKGSVFSREEATRVVDVQFHSRILRHSDLINL